MIATPDIPGHRITEVIGEGGFATVYRGWQVAVGREVAVKVDNRVLLSERDRRRFVREVTAAGRLSGHPHVVDIYDAGTLDDGRPYMVMEFCPGGSLADAVSRNGVMSPARVRDIGIKIADALAAAHAANVLHRDVKPANILVSRYGVVGLSDFGLASILLPGGEQSVTREALTPAYASPERFRGHEPTAACDLYSLAATLYSLLTGRPPHFPADGGTPSFATLVSLHDNPVDDIPGVPSSLMATLRGTLAADPAMRPRSAEELRDALIAAPQSQSRPEPNHRPLTMPQADGAVGETDVRDASLAASARHARKRLPGGSTIRVDEVAGRRRPKARLAAFAAVAVVIIAAATFFGARELSAQTHKPPAAASLPPHKPSATASPSPDEINTDPGQSNCTYGPTGDLCFQTDSVDLTKCTAIVSVWAYYKDFYGYFSVSDSGNDGGNSPGNREWRAGGISYKFTIPYHNELSYTATAWEYSTATGNYTDIGHLTFSASSSC